MYVYDRKILTIVSDYGNTYVRILTIVTVKEDQWLQDSNIEFFYEWMEREKLPKAEIQSIFLLRPSIGFLIASIAQQGGVVDESLLPTDFLDAKYVFIPVTDNVDPTKAGGSHWSLLLVGVAEKTAWYLDSLPTSGPDKLTDARCYSKAIDQVFQCQFELVVAPAPKQVNGSDCGIHVCMETDILLGRLQATKDGAAIPFDPSLATQSMNASAYRESLQKLIHDMIQYRGRRIGKVEDITVSPERRSSSRTRPSIDQRLEAHGMPEKIPE
ncbi:NEDD8-specific protease 2 [Taphrina deformans PYCC 5710]|uniref:NEDD8-specific protease 2 n=1 Tax=Taphrina deformans (strain PYCC 5710 / ATCC 11124 / CBS 356.35 / IMI 108563 / JCM 9778 / NBRC 8474) TaxID=1097556 RepID=R4XBV0_TAPDE|nr:NEDD8-specific protease 2 [Taphrina deformans PYCC 5710]|eukprot:CCG80820.1 NEDD8-specific protease 2 [Taphrina deformans PYCC 5710]